MDKIDRLLDAMEHPERYTSDEIDLMLQDPEVKEVFDLLDKTKSSLQTIVTPDIVKEWNRFDNKHINSGMTLRRRLQRAFTRNAAASIAIIIASFTAVATIADVGLHYFKSKRVENGPIVEMAADTVALRADTFKTVEATQVALPETVVFNDDILETIVKEIAAYYDRKVIFNSDSSKSLRLYFRWNQELTVEEVVGRLNNFEQIHITVTDKTIEVD